MFAQQVEATGNNLLIAAAQGSANYGPSMITALMSFNAEKALEYFGTTDADYSEEAFETWPSAEKFEEAVGQKIAISVIENLTPNPAQTNPQPKINPQTGEILLSDGSPIYRHTEVVISGTEQTVLLKHNSTVVADAFATEKVDTVVDTFAAVGATSIVED